MVCPENHFRQISLFTKTVFSAVCVVLCFLAATSLTRAQCQPGGAPQLSVATGPDFKQLTLSWTGVSGSNGYYYVYGSQNGGAIYGDPIIVLASQGQAVNYGAYSWGISAPMDTYQTYHFYVTTYVCGVLETSNVASGTTRDIDAPVLTIVQGAEFDEVTHTVTAVAGAELYVDIYGSPSSSGPWGDPLRVSFSYAGQTKTFSTSVWGISAQMQTNQTYYFYAKAVSGNRVKTSAVVSATTRDIAAPELTVTKLPDRKARLTWNRVDGATYYYVQVFSTAQNQWNNWQQVYQTSNPQVVYNDPWALGMNETRYYRVFAYRNGRTRYSDPEAVYFNSDENLGDPLCNKGANMGVGEPVNVSNGNMYLSQTDYVLPGVVGENINVSRAYNSGSSTQGIFGLGWTTAYDEKISFPLQDDYTIRLLLPDGRAVYFGRTDLSQPFSSSTPDFYGQIVKNTDDTYTLTLKTGTIHHFGSNGKLLWQKDRNGNQTTLNYDTGGNLTSVTDAFGRTLTFTMSSGLVTQISDSTGLVADYVYNANNTLQSVTYADGSKYQFVYTTVGSQTLLATVKDALNNILETHEYDSSGRATTSEKDGGVEKYTLDYSNPAFTTVTDALGRITKYYYETGRGRNVVTKIEGNCNCGGGTEVTNFEYDGNLNVTKKTDALSNQVSYSYDSQGNMLSATDVLGTESYTYNSFGGVLTRTDRMNGVTTNTFDASGNLLTTKDPLNNTTTLTYTSIGQLATVKDARNNTTTLTYDSSGRLTEIKDANNKTTNYGYDARARITSVTDALNQTTTVEYDLNNRLKKVIYPDTKFVEFTYDLAGRRTKTKDARGNETNFAYDSAYRLTSVTDALNHATAFGYDLMSNLTSRTDALGNTTDYEYDNFDRLKKVIYPPATTGATRLEERIEYDAVGNVKKRIDTANRETIYDHDTAHRLIKTTDALNKITQFEYNARSQMTKVKDALNQEYVFTYDALGRQLSQTRASSTMSYEYDAVGNRTKRTDYTGRVTDYTYDVLNRLTNISYVNQSSANATYAYDDLSRLVSATNNAGTVSLTYDNRNRLKTSTDVFSHVVEYGYDENGNRNLLKFDNANYATYAYDVANRLTSITNSSDSANIAFGYDNANRLTSKVLPNGITTSYNYDGLSRLTRLKDETTSAVLFDRQMSYNAASQISQILEPSLTRNFSYDNVDRLTNVTNGASTTIESYAFNDVGSRTSSHLSSSYSYQSNNRLTASQSASYGYNSNGAMTSKTISSVTTNYTWDYENRMTSASDGTTTVSYEYDALGRRTKQTQGATVTKFIYDGLDVLVDDNAGTLTKYLNGLGIDSKLRVQTGSSVSYFLTDHLGSTNGLADSTGNLTASTSYDSFGNATNTSFPTRYQFTGREFDSSTGLHYYRARWYDAQLGRFISEDPIGFAGGDVNLFAYVKNNAANRKDPLGLFDLGTLTAAGTAVVSTPGVGQIVAVGAGGLALGYAIGYYPGQWIARYRFPEQFPDTQTSPQTQPEKPEKCETKPKPSPKPIPAPAPTPPSGNRGRWTCLARCHVNNFSDVPNAPSFCYGQGSGASQRDACQAAMNEAQAASPPGTYARHCRCTECWQR